MKTKIDTIRDLASRGDWHGAIKIAGSFPRLGRERKAITRAKEAVCRPDFQRQLGHDPEKLISEGIDAMRRKWAL